MDKASANPFLVCLLFMARCMVPVLIMLGITYLLRRLGFIAEPPEPPPGYDDETNADHENYVVENNENPEANPGKANLNPHREGDLAHGKT